MEPFEVSIALYEGAWGSLDSTARFLPLTSELEATATPSFTISQGGEYH